VSRYRIAIDIGGTFTDFVMMDRVESKFLTGKTLTTPVNQAEGVMTGLRQLISDPGEVEFIVHGTTVGLNAFLERKGKRVLLITTAGVGDFYSIARGDRKELYTLQYRKPQLLVPRSDVMEVHERLRWDGTVAESLQESDLIPITQRLRDEGIEAVAVCFIHAYINPEHELRVREILHKALPTLSVTLSHEVAREWREYERASSAVMNAYIAPIVERYLVRLEHELHDFGLRPPLHVMQSSGGVMTATAARGMPIQTLLSGPVGGTIGGAGLAGQTQRQNLLCIDMGGTSFDMSLIVGGQPRLSTETELEGLPLLMPLVDIQTIGAGGGSIAILEAGALRVGPQSAGADPGPACYGRGGTQPTVTDANLVLGRLNPANFLGGRMTLDVEAARKAITRMAAQLALTDVALAEGILAIVNAKMADAMRTITVRQGIDPRDFSLVAFGGAGAMHAVWLAQELDIREVIVPWSPGTFSAWGMLHTDIRHDLTRTFYRVLAGLPAADVEAFYEELADEGREFLRSENVSDGDMYLLRTADMRYVGQEYFVNVSVEAPAALDTIAASFHATHHQRYGHSTPDAPVEFVNLRLAALGRLPRQDSSGETPAHGSAAEEKRTVVFDGKEHHTVVLLRHRLRPGDEHHGPLVIEEETATTVVPPGWKISVDRGNNILITPEASHAS
jgi:N-methylhydantoinase A